MEENDRLEEAWRSRLRRAVSSQTVDPGLEDKLRSRLMAGDGRPSFRWQIAAVAIVVAAGAGAWLYRARTVEAAARIAVGDHRSCRLSKQPPDHGSAEALEGKGLDERYRALPKEVAGKIPVGYELVSAHHCSFEGKRVVHMVVKRGEKVISVVVEPGQAGSARITEQEVDGFEASGIDTGRESAYVVSDLPIEQHRVAVQAVLDTITSLLAARS